MPLSCLVSEKSTMYIHKAGQVVAEAGLTSRVKLNCTSIYNPQLRSLFTGASRFDAAYFSGSLTLMPARCRTRRDASRYWAAALTTIATPTPTIATTTTNAAITSVAIGLKLVFAKGALLL